MAPRASSTIRVAQVDAAGTIRIHGSPRAGSVVVLEMPDDRIAFAWGYPDQPGTCAYWVDQARRQPSTLDLSCGNSLREEVLFCLLGGFGITYALNSAAWEALRRVGLTVGTPPADEIERVLRAPLTLPDGTVRRYRFPAQRADRLSATMRMLEHSVAPSDPAALRNWLTGLPGVGRKTASWIVRNRCGDDRIAVIDVHIQRAGIAAGFFRSSWRLPQDYESYELAFCAIAGFAGVRTAILDLTIWEQLNQIGRAYRHLLGAPSVLDSG